MNASKETPASWKSLGGRRLPLALATGLLALALVLVVVFRPAENVELPVYESFGLPLVAVQRVQVCANETIGPRCSSGGISVAVADLDSDGQLEIVAVGGGQPSGEVGSAEILTIWQYAGGALNLKEVAWNRSSTFEARALCLADVGGDSRLEIVTGGWGPWYDRRAAYLAVWEWDGADLTRLTNFSWTWNNEDTNLESVVCTDLDGDGRTDIAATGYAEPRSGPYVGRVGWISVWNATSDLKALQRAAETDLWSTQGDVEPHAAAIVGTSVFVAGRTSDYANDTVGGLLGLFSFNGTAVVTLETQVISNAYYFVASKAEPTGPGAFRLVVGGYDGLQKTIIETVSVSGSAVSAVGPRTDYRVPMRPDNYTGFRGLAMEGDLAVASGWVDQGDGYSFVQELNGSSGRWVPNLLSEWRYLVQVNAAASWVGGVTIADVETGGRPEVVSVGQAWDKLELRVWRLPA